MRAMLWACAVSRCTLQVGESVVLVAQGGPPEAEYALFDPGEIELLATEPGRIREIGYRTIVAHACTRLAQSGITRDAAQAAAAALKPSVARAYARGPAVRRVIDRFGPAELFEGGSLDATTGRYAGTWMDLDALATDLGLPRAPATIQALHLAAALAECDDDLAVVLATSQVSAEQRPGERTYKRATFESPAAITGALRSLKPAAERERSEAGPAKHDIVAWARDRARLVPASRDRMAAIEAALDTRDAPLRGPLADGELWTLETKLSAGDVSGVAERLDAFEKRRGRLPGTTYLRARLAFTSGSEEPRAIAERVSALSTSMANFHELQLLAAQAWVAAGDERRARAFARDLMDNKTAPDDLRMQALEVLDVVGQSSSSLPQARTATPAPDTQPTGALEALTARSAEIGGAGVPKRAPGDSGPRTPLTPRAPSSPRGPSSSSSDLTPSSSERPGSTPRPGSGGGRPRSSDSQIRTGESRGSGPRRSLPPGASLPPFRVEPRGEANLSSPPPGDVEPESVESLSLPPGMRTEPPPADEAPRTPTAARLSFTYLARELARELRLRHGTELRSDVDGLEVAQRHLREALPDGRVRTPDDQRDVMRTAAFLAELLARRLGARWADLEATEPGAWSMLVPCRGGAEVMRIWPIGRVLRFVSAGHRERDLVSYYLELQLRAR